MVSPPTPLHLTEDELATLASLGTAGFDKNKLEHVIACDTCREAVDDVSIYEAIWIASEGSMRWPNQPDRLPESIAPRRSYFHRLRRWQPVLAAALAIVVVGVGAQEIAKRRASDALLEPVRTAIRGHSQPSVIAIPGFLDLPVTQGDNNRSGFVAITEELDAALRQLTQAYRDGTAGENGAVTLVGGYIATGQFGMAGSIARGALERFPDNVEIAVGAALADFGEGRLAPAQRALSRIVEAQPENALALINLAAVSSAAGDTATATAMARRAIAASDENPLAERARMIIDANNPR